MWESTRGVDTSLKLYQTHQQIIIKGNRDILGSINSIILQYFGMGKKVAYFKLSRRSAAQESVTQR